MQTFRIIFPEDRVIRSAYSVKPQVQFDCLEAEKPYGRTKQSFKDECDINTIIQRFLRTGQLDLANKLEPRYGDCTGIEFQSACQTVAAAKSLFAELPAALRNRFENEPAKFLDFVHDDRNIEEARELGLLKPKADPAVTPAPAPAPSTTTEATKTAPATSAPA